jgi:hypothetical protein
MRRMMLLGARSEEGLGVSSCRICLSDNAFGGEDDKQGTNGSTGCEFVSIIYLHNTRLCESVAFCPFYHKSVLGETSARCCSASHINCRDRFRFSLSANRTR